jgi:phosphoribosylaminoimidazolecarboxamide formyltransferase/IMP cyclohydrolase
MKKRAILSVSDKTGIVDFARNLVDLGFKIYQYFIMSGGNIFTDNDKYLEIGVNKSTPATLTYASVDDS